LKYSLDTSAILEAWRRRYPPDVFPVVWRRIEDLIRPASWVPAKRC
jgi:hypothetical protein